MSKYVHFLLYKLINDKNEHVFCNINIYVKLSDLEKMDMFDMLEQLLKDNHCIRLSYIDMKMVRAFACPKIVEE